MLCIAATFFAFELTLADGSTDTGEEQSLFFIPLAIENESIMKQLSLVDSISFLFTFTQI